MENKKETIYLDFLGLPGSGKTTTAYKLKEELEKQGQEVLYFAEYWEKNMREYFLSLGKFKRHVLPVLYSLRDLRIWRIMFLYVLVYFENFLRGGVIKDRYILRDNLHAFKRHGLLKFSCKLDNNFKNKILQHGFSFFIEDESLLKGLIQGVPKYRPITKKLLNRFIIKSDNISYKKKLFIHLQVNNNNLLINRVMNDENREGHILWDPENKIEYNNLSDYFNSRVNKYEKLMELVKEKTKNQENLYFLELEAKDSVEINVEKIMEYLEKIKS